MLNFYMLILFPNMSDGILWKLGDNYLVHFQIGQELWPFWMAHHSGSVSLKVGMSIILQNFCRWIISSIVQKTCHTSNICNFNTDYVIFSCGIRCNAENFLLQRQTYFLFKLDCYHRCFRLCCVQQTWIFGSSEWCCMPQVRHFKAKERYKMHCLWEFL